MSEIEKQIEDLRQQLIELRNRQLQMSREILSAEQQLQSYIGTSAVKPEIVESAITEEVVVAATAPAPTANKPYIQELREELQRKSAPLATNVYANKRGLEDFIGTNLISKVGILITIIGVFIGAKYAIDNELISPAMRIVAGYVSGVVLALFSLKLKEKYLYFSSILAGGALSVTYFITYIGFNYYSLFPQWLAFVIMVITTALAVATALWYNQKIIALLGQVAAYAIPFLLSDGGGNVFVMFGYISLINVGLLALSLRKDWKILYHIAFFLTWLIYAFWVLELNEINKNFTGGIIFLAVNFFTFYATFLSYKIIKKEQYNRDEIGILLVNALLFFFLGSALIRSSFTNVHFLTFFTLLNAAIHFAAGYFIYRTKLADKTVFQFVAGLGLLFVTVAIPIELDGSWVTLLWSVEATTLFYIGIKNERRLYLDIAVPLVFVAVGSLVQDWYNTYPFLKNSYGSYAKLPFANINFYISLFVSACLLFMTASFKKSKLSETDTWSTAFFSLLVPAAFLVLCYFTFFNEIHYGWDKKIFSNGDNISGRVLKLYQGVSLLVYSFIFVASWLSINKRILQDRRMHDVLIGLSFILITVYLVHGLSMTGELREIYLSKNFSNPSIWLLFSRYILLAGLALLWISIWQSLKLFTPTTILQAAITIVFNVTLLSVICNEFIHFMDLAGYQNQYKLGLSLICGGYALTLLFIGILKKKKTLRMFAIVLFGVTLLKLFFYDLASLSTISKTIVLVLLGVLLLLASFLYNKYKELLFGKDENPVDV